MAGRAEDIPEPGDYFVTRDLGVPLLVIRGADGTIRRINCQERRIWHLHEQIDRFIGAVAEDLRVEPLPAPYIERG